MNIDSWLRRTLIIGLCLVPFIPFIVTNTFFFPFITGKNFAFRILVEIMFALWAILALRDASVRPRLPGQRGWQLLPMAIIGLLVSVGISTVFAENPGKAFWSNFERMEGWISLAHSVVYFFIAYTVLNAEKLWQRFWSVSLGAAAAMGFYGFLQLAGVFLINQGGVRVDGMFGNATYLAVYMLFHAFMALWFVVRGKDDKTSFRFSYWTFTALQVFMLFFTQVSETETTKQLIKVVFSSLPLFLLALAPHLIVWLAPLLSSMSSVFSFLTRPRAWFITVCLFAVSMIFYAATRGTILGLLGGIVLMGACLVIFAKGEHAKSIRIWGAAAALAVLLVIGGFIAIKDTDFVKQSPVLTRFSTLSIEDILKTRLTIWNMALKGFSERPVFGWGPEGFNHVFNKYYAPSMYAQEPWFDRAHNAFLDWLVAGGIVAFVLYGSFYLLAFWYIWRKTDFSLFEKSLFTGLVAAYAFNNMAVFDNLVSFIFFMTTLAYILSRSAKLSSADAVSVSGKPVSEGTYMIASSVIVVVMAFVLYFANVPGMTAASDLIQGLSPQCVDAAKKPIACTATGAVRDLNRNLDYFKRANANQTVGRQEAREQLVQFSAQVTNLNPNDPTFNGQVAQYAREQMQDEIAKSPNDARLYTFLGSFARQMGDYEGALAALTKAHELSPGKQQIIFELAILENNSGNFSGALEWFKKAYESEPAFDDARIFYAATAIRSGNASLGYQLLQERYGTLTPDNDYILEAYLATKDFAKAITIAESRVAANPQSAQMHVRLAAAYLTAGRRDDAVAELRRAIELDPSFEQQGNYYIQEIQAGRNP